MQEKYHVYIADMRCIITKKQLKRARYLANCLFGQGTYLRRDSSKDTKTRNYVDEDGEGVVWNETPCPPNVEVCTEFVSKGTPSICGEYDELLTILGFDSDAKASLQENDYTDSSEPEPHQDIEDTVAVAVEHLGQEAEPPQEAQPTEPEPHQGTEDAAEAAVKTLDVYLTPRVSVREVQVEVHLDEAGGKDQTAIAANAINPRAKRDKCATMRLAKEYGLPAETEFAKIVEQFGNDAVTRYQDLLRLVPSFGLTEADVRHAFPHEYAMLPL